MNRLQLATLLSWAGDSGFKGRKRLQKVVFLLQDAGCPLDCRFTLHHFGPYSREVADRCDEMVAAGLVKETGGPAEGDLQYTYVLPSEVRKLLDQSPDPQMHRFQELGTELIGEAVWPLELGSTILLFHGQTHDWNKALLKACEFKKTPPSVPAALTALALAQRVRGLSGTQA